MSTINGLPAHALLVYFLVVVVAALTGALLVACGCVAGGATAAGVGGRRGGCCHRSPHAADRCSGRMAAEPCGDLTGRHRSCATRRHDGLRQRRAGGRCAFDRYTSPVGQTRHAARQRRRSSSSSSPLRSALPASSRCIASVSRVRAPCGQIISRPSRRVPHADVTERPLKPVNDQRLSIADPRVGGSYASLVAALLDGLQRCTASLQRHGVTVGSSARRLNR